MKKSSIAKLAAAVVAVALGTAYASVATVGSAVVQPKKLTVVGGDSPAVLYDRLKVPVARWRYDAYLKFFQKGYSLQSGTYEIKAATSLSTLFSTNLKVPTTKDLTITILPGWTLYDIDAYLAGLSLIQPGDLSDLSAKTFADLKANYPFLTGLTTIEGTLYPDTYRIRPDATLEDILKTPLSTFQSRIYDKLTAAQKKNFYPTLILASILEKEERDPDQKPIVAGILAKRLREGIALGADATVCYPYKITSHECTPSFIANHLGDASPYDTRSHRGLPPTPISNPSRDTWLAALNPEESDYYYYLHDSNGVIHYGRTLDEHNLNRKTYLGK